MFVYDVAVIGTGLASLFAANYLTKENLNVVVLERENRVGGRVLTHHLPDGIHFEQGAFSFGNGEQTLFQSISELALPIINHTQMDKSFCFKNHRGTLSEKGLFLTGKEKEIPLYQLLTYFRCELEKIVEDISLSDALNSIQASSNAIEWLQANTILGLLGNNFETVSVKAALAFLKQYDNSNAFYSLQGGNDQITQLLAKELKGRILLNRQVLKVTQLNNVCILKGKNFRLAAQKVIFAIPLHELNKIQIDPPLSLEKKHAIRNISYTLHARISIVAPPKVLTSEPRGGVFLFSDQVGWFREQSAFQVDPYKKTVIDVSVAGDRAEKLSKSLEKWIDAINAILLQNFPKWDAKQAKYYPYVWKEAYSCFPPKSYHYQNKLYKSEGNFHFAGEHTSQKFASMNGSIESGIRAAQEILQSKKTQKFPAILSSL